ncbi:hypothetical protein POREN0001_0896 [Porphyromonas endodontalis ATCC 35406]|uniref:Uncharacterized protein n=1 Tax=Porphyromonas endodontalis (strain ATCC 35406 / DSM 24491 / JCM 8526 / CCUG 16442 / BCRC 14492 / NCTC 13058 / HG 370) TaxID=553175 RepID=C3J9X4_POREA|nr:hypothetical protein POREN0001_0896 [Porphyromonas endodontalis ATCC 35406]
MVREFCPLSPTKNSFSFCSRWGSEDFFYLKSFPFSLESLYPYPLFLEKILCAFALFWIGTPSYLFLLYLYFCYY